jgi:hypothetical protein
MYRDNLNNTVGTVPVPIWTTEVLFTFYLNPQLFYVNFLIQYFRKSWSLKVK